MNVSKYHLAHGYSSGEWFNVRCAWERPQTIDYIKKLLFIPYLLAFFFLYSPRNTFLYSFLSRYGLSDAFGDVFF